jgi:hypothetical protein
MVAFGIAATSVGIPASAVAVNLGVVSDFKIDKLTVQALGRKDRIAGRQNAVCCQFIQQDYRIRNTDWPAVTVTSLSTLGLGLYLNSFRSQIPQAFC